MEFIIEFIFGIIFEGTLELWTNFMKKRNPDYDNSRSKKIFPILIGILLTLLTMILIFVITILIIKIIHDLKNRILE